MIAGAKTKTALVGKRRNPVFLEEDLDHVGHDLQQAEWANPVRAIAILPQREQPALEPDQPGSDSERHDEDAEDRQLSDRGSPSWLREIYSTAATLSPSSDGSPVGRPATPFGRPAVISDRQTPSHHRTSEPNFEASSGFSAT